MDVWQGKTSRPKPCGVWIQDSQGLAQLVLAHFLQVWHELKKIMAWHGNHGKQAESWAVHEYNTMHHQIIILVWKMISFIFHVAICISCFFCGVESLDKSRGICQVGFFVSTPATHICGFVTLGAQEMPLQGGVLHLYPWIESHLVFFFCSPFFFINFWALYWWKIHVSTHVMIYDNV